MIQPQLSLLILLAYMAPFAIWAGPRYLALLRGRRLYPGNQAHEQPAQALRRGFWIWLAGLSWLLLASFSNYLFYRFVSSLLVLTLILGVGLVVSAPAGSMLRRRPVRYVLGGCAVWACGIWMLALLSGDSPLDVMGWAAFPALTCMAAIPIFRWARMGEAG